MSDSIPSAAPDPETTNQRLPANAEDRKAAAALSSLNTNEIAADAGSGTGVRQPSAADQEALGKAMSRLEMAAGKDSGGKKKPEAARKEAEVARKKAVKVADADVGVLVSSYSLYDL